MTNHLPYLVERNPGYLEYQLPISVKLVVDIHGRGSAAAQRTRRVGAARRQLEVGEAPERGVRREVAEELGLTVTNVDIIDAWVYEIARERHAFIVSYGTTYTGDERPAYSSEHKELGLYAYHEVPSLHMPEPYKLTIARWSKRIGA